MSTPPYTQVDISLAERSYPIFIGGGLLRDPQVLTGNIAARDILVVTNSMVAPLYLDGLLASLPGKRSASLVLPDGEQHKTLETFARILDALVDERMNRDAAIVALGGGVVGDMAGFAAACYQRGIDYVQIPTTLLAQVDSSVGGKTGVNHPRGKNMIGAFHQPRAVFADTDTLATLSEREYRAGLAEVLKYGLIYDASFLDWIEANSDALLRRAAPAVMHAVTRCCEIKAAVVGADEREQGLRAILNLGHTFGHAIETASGYGNWLHGEAVAAGMAIAADMSHRLGWLKSDERERIDRLITHLGLPASAPQIGASRAAELMGMDKKVLDGRIRLVLLHRLGEAAVVGDYPPAILSDTLRHHFG